MAGKTGKKEIWPTKAIIVGYDGIDYDRIEDWVPDDPLHADRWGYVYLSSDGVPETSTRFTFRAVTPQVLSELKGPKEKRYLVVVPYYSWQAVEAEIEAIVDKCEGNSWVEIHEKLSTYLRSEDDWSSW